MLKACGKVASVQTSEWEFNGRSGITHAINLIEEGGFIRKVKASGEKFSVDQLPKEGDQVELPVRVFAKAREDGSVIVDLSLDQAYGSSEGRVKAVS